MKNWKILKSDADYKAAVDRLEDVIDANMGTREGDELELLALLIKDYEDKHYPAKLPDPVDMIKLRMEEMGLKNKDLVDIIGSESHVSSVLGRKRQITLEMARKLSRRLNIRAGIFINDNLSFESYETAVENVDYNNSHLIGHGKNVQQFLKKMNVSLQPSEDKTPVIIYYADQSAKEHAYILADLVAPALKANGAKSEYLSDFVVRISGERAGD